MKTVTIELERWNAQNNPYCKCGKISLLMNTSGNMCCLGFVCRAIGHSNMDIINVSMPSTLSLHSRGGSKFNKLKRYGLVKDSGADTMLSSDAATINDMKSCQFYFKMKSLSELFYKHNIRLRFVLRGWIVLHDVHYPSK